MSTLPSSIIVLEELVSSSSRNSIESNEEEEEGAHSQSWSEMVCPTGNLVTSMTAPRRITMTSWSVLLREVSKTIHDLVGLPRWRSGSSGQLCVAVWRAGERQLYRTIKSWPSSTMLQSPLLLCAEFWGGMCSEGAQHSRSHSSTPRKGRSDFIKPRITSNELSSGGQLFYSLMRRNSTVWGVIAPHLCPEKSWGVSSAWLPVCHQVQGIMDQHQVQFLLCKFSWMQCNANLNLSWILIWFVCERSTIKGSILTHYTMRAAMPRCQIR